MKECCFRSDNELSLEANMTGCNISLVEPSAASCLCICPKTAAMPTLEASVPTVVFNRLTNGFKVGADGSHS